MLLKKVNTFSVNRGVLPPPPLHCIVCLCCGFGPSVMGERGEKSTLSKPCLILNLSILCNHSPPPTPPPPTKKPQILHLVFIEKIICLVLHLCQLGCLFLSCFFYILEKAQKSIIKNPNLKIDPESKWSFGSLSLLDCLF